jgi:hypothetical protein
MTAVDWLFNELEEKANVSEHTKSRILEFKIDVSIYLDIKRKGKEIESKQKMITDEEFVKLYNQIIRTQHLHGYKDISTDYHLGYLHGLDYLFNYIKRQNDKTNG